VVRTIALFCLALAGCTPAETTCGMGTDPVIVTGLSGALEGVTPSVEIQLRQPDTCAVIDTLWMFWDDPTSTLSIGEAPTEGTLRGAGVESDEYVIFFREHNLGVRLEYPDDVVGPQLSLVWFSNDVDLTAVDCAHEGDFLACTVRAP
jgi:hypothetical protein